MGTKKRDRLLERAFKNAKLLDAIEQTMTIEPCHTSGMHDPTHTTKYVCTIQKGQAFDRVLALLGRKKPKRRLHPEGCYWCHGNPEARTTPDELRKWVRGRS